MIEVERPPFKENILDSRFLSQFLGTLYKKHGMSISYKDGYVDSLTPCNFMCSIHGVFTNKPYNIVHQKNKSNGCSSCASEKMRMINRTKKVYGVGTNDWDGLIYTTRNDKIPEYKMWKDMLKRVYSEKYQEKSKTYIGASCDPKWLSLKGFIEDVSQLPNYEKALTGRWCLDKDIIVSGNKHYSKDNCAFVPYEINANFRSTDKVNDLPVGVYLHKGGKFACDCSVANKAHYLGVYDTVEQAFMVRKEFKQKQMKMLADKYRGVVDQRVINKLENYDYDLTGRVY